MSQRYLGIILSGKKGPSSVPVDHERAFELFADAAGQEYGLAPADSASAYDSCLGVAPLLELSIFWYSKVAMQGVVSARRNLAASHYRKGIDDKCVPATAPIALFSAADDPHANRMIRAMERLTVSICWYCAAPGSTLPSRLLRCSRCKEGLYCSVEHQKKHWKLHKCEEVKVANEEYE